MREPRQHAERPGQRQRMIHLRLATLSLGLLISCSDGDRDSGAAPGPDRADAWSGPAGSPDAAAGAAPVALRVFIRNTASPGDGAALDVVFSPGVYWIHGAGVSLFEAGAPASAGLERLAEDGAFEPLLRETEQRSEGTAGFFGADDLGVSYDEAPLMPGQSADFAVEARPGDHLELAMMWAQSNDIFVATLPGGIALFDGGEPRSGVVEGGASLYDAGTEVNQEPGFGDAQAPRQAEPDQGSPEDGVVTALADGQDGAGFSYPSLDGTLEVEIALDAP